MNNGSVTAELWFALFEKRVQALDAIFGLDAVHLEADFLVEYGLESAAVIAHERTLDVANR